MTSINASNDSKFTNLDFNQLFHEIGAKLVSISKGKKFPQGKIDFEIEIFREIIQLLKSCLYAMILDSFFTLWH